jgi:predicted enzyme related to lactoylglutathione lyase
MKLAADSPKESIAMGLVSLRVITDDLERAAQFYERVTGMAAVRTTSVFAELVMPSCTLAFGHTQTTKLFGEGSAHPADNHSVIIEFRVDDVEREYERLKSRSLDRRINSLRRAGKRRSAAALRRVSHLVECSEGRLGKLGGPQEVAADGVVEGGE